ncbi:unannotated protein [freshwater metagenome]|uniref:Unannotated protein n=1 Tax=freshwater metagenome TaxID=449393 RepID=A0A6J7EB87_9ZZZZ
MTDIGASAAAEWAALVGTAVLGTDRRPLPPPAAGWESLGRDATSRLPDAAVELLDRAAAVATARRAGIRPGPALTLMPPAPVDPRPVCSDTASLLLGRLLVGEHDVLLPEWFARCRSAGLQIPPHLVPALLLRGRRNPTFDAAARSVIGQRAAWLAEAMPELGIKGIPTAPARALAAPAVQPFVPPAPPPDSGAVVSAIVSTFHDQAATWAAAPQLRTAVAGIDPVWLPALILELNRASFSAVTERARVDLLGLARTRMQMVEAFAEAAPDGAAIRPDDPAGTRVRLAP